MELTFWGWIERLWTSYSSMFLNGTKITLLVAITGTIVGFVIGLLVAIVRTIPIDKKSNPIKKIFLRVINALLSIYVEVFRGTPMMVQAVIIYYGSLEAFGIDIPVLPAALLIVSINTGAYMAEIARGGIVSIDPGQYEGAHAIGMTHWQTMFNVVLPQAVRNILPAVGNEFVINIKDTSVLNVITLNELFFMTMTVQGINLRSYETYLIAAVIYLILTFTISRILRLIERKMDGSDTYTIHGGGTMPQNSVRIKKNKEGLR